VVDISPGCLGIASRRSLVIWLSWRYVGAVLAQRGLRQSRRHPYRWALKALHPARLRAAARCNSLAETLSAARALRRAA
jgi:hypothetical protein